MLQLVQPVVVDQATCSWHSVSAIAERESRFDRCTTVYCQTLTPLAEAINLFSLTRTPSKPPPYGYTGINLFLPKVLYPFTVVRYRTFIPTQTPAKPPQNKSIYRHPKVVRVWQYMVLA